MTRLYLSYCGWILRAALLVGGLQYFTDRLEQVCREYKTQLTVTRVAAMRERSAANQSTS